MSNFERPKRENAVTQWHRLKWLPIQGGTVTYAKTRKPNNLSSAQHGVSAFARFRVAAEAVRNHINETCGGIA